MKQKPTFKAVDAKERDKCRRRSGGLCEVRMVAGLAPHVHAARCYRPATENHHRMGGWRLRNRGESVLARNRLDCCRNCHAAIERNRFEPVDWNERDWAGTVVFRRSQ